MPRNDQYVSYFFMTFFSRLASERIYIKYYINKSTKKKFVHKSSLIIFFFFFATSLKKDKRKPRCFMNKIPLQTKIIDPKFPYSTRFR